ncbi:BgtTE-56007 [Blumeria graminis f. sp. tritici]|uniref:BgtTE-56007 n=1 Tax=Blumeria graminis f. sp. tritici TaxID=62690 RepID=A0A9X9PRI4_BLUGR|nr:BgtTE-56007 [Blumeria graminis f. sp. tritici]
MCCWPFRRIFMIIGFLSRFRGTSAGATMWSMVVNNNSKERTSTTSIYSFIYVKASSPPRLIPLLFLCYGTPLVF